MSRIQSLVSRPKRTLAALATVLIAVGITTASGANFTASSANAGNIFTAGTMTIGNSQASAILTATNMKPADATTNAVGTVDITNTGSLAGDFTLSRSSLTDTPVSPAISGKLNATILDCGAWTVTPPDCVTATVSKYSGTIAGMTSSVSLGNFAAGVKHRYKFTVALDGTADNTYQGASSTVGFTWAAS